MAAKEITVEDDLRDRLDGVDFITAIILVTLVVPFTVGQHLVIANIVIFIAAFLGSPPQAFKDRLHAKELAWLVFDLDFYKGHLLPVVSDLCD